MTLELVLWAPLVVAAILALAALGVISSAQNRADTAAFAAARSASLAPSAARAASTARVVAAQEVTGARACTDLDLDVNVRDFRPGGSVEVTVRCTTNLTGLTLIPAQVVRSSTARVPLETYRDFTGAVS
jgi:TadE-like protein